MQREVEEGTACLLALRQADDRLQPGEVSHHDQGQLGGRPTLAGHGRRGQSDGPVVEQADRFGVVEAAGDGSRHPASVRGRLGERAPAVASVLRGRWDTDLVTHGRAEIHELLLANDLRPSRALGQNFVADGNTVRRIVRLAGVTEGRRVVEVGAGLGSLTLALAEAGASVTAVEIDRHVLPVLRSQVEPLGVRVVEADALRLDWPELLGGERQSEAAADDSWALVANLPYNVAVPLVIRVLEEAPQVSSLLVMVQREVGERLAASVGDDAYGAVSVKVAYWATSAVVGRVSASVFIPMPRVESVLVRLDRRPGSGEGRTLARPGSSDYERLFSVVRGGFAHRRKMLRRSLYGLVPAGAFAATGIRPTARAEELSLGEWERLASWRPEDTAPPGQPGPEDRREGR